MHTALVIWSLMTGVGKNILLEAVQRILGLNATFIGDEELFGKFNASWQLDKQLIIGDEVQGGHDKRTTAEKLKLLITSPEVWVEQKYGAKFSVPNVANYVFLTNNPDPFYIADQDRRYWVWEVSQSEPLSQEFYAKFKAWKNSDEGVAALYWYLLHEVDTTDFDPDARAPMTQAKREMIELNRSTLERWVRDLITSRSLVCTQWRSFSIGTAATRNVMDYIRKKATLR